MKHLAALLVPLLLGAAPIRYVVNYTLAPEMKDGAITALEVTAQFRADPSGTTVFDWTDGWAGEARLGQWARDLTVEGAQAATLAPHGGRVIHAAPGTSIVVRYRVVSAFTADPNASDVRQPMPVVRPTWFYGVGEALFATPSGHGDAPATFAWKGPADVKFASDLEHDGARAGMATKTVDGIIESIVIGGRDLKVANSNAGGAPLRVATLGSYAFDVPRFDALAASIVTTERGFWRTKNEQPFLITMVPLVSAPGHISYSGTGRSDAFALWMDASADMSNLAWLLAHEYFHTWNYRQLGELGDDEAMSYWLSEGFTDFYARRLLLRAGLITPAVFASSWNETLADYARSTYRSLPKRRPRRTTGGTVMRRSCPISAGRCLRRSGMLGCGRPGAATSTTCCASNADSGSARPWHRRSLRCSRAPPPRMGSTYARMWFATSSRASR
jgi:predicted metalloprotease with PDZ domain